MTYPRRMITKTAFTPTGPATTGSAPGIWRLDEVAYWKKQGLWPDPAIVPDQYFPYVSLLLSSTSLSNANNNLFVDSSGAFNPVSRNGNTTQGSFSPYSTNWSNYFDGSGDWISAPDNAAFDFGSGDFTVEFWINFNSVTGTIGLIGKRANETLYSPFLMEMTSSALRLYMSTSGSSWAVNGLATPTLVTGSWYHIAVSRSGTTVYMFVNGTSVGSTASLSGAVMTNTSPFYFGANSGSPVGAAALNGYMSNIRIVKGTAVYTANFTPPTAPLTAISGTSILTCQSNRFRDASSNNFTITPNGNTSVQDFGPFSPAYPGAVYNQGDITNWSGYFDGTGDNLVSPSSTAFAFGTGDYTIECWIYPISTQANMRLWQFSDNNDNADINIGSTGSLNYYNGSTSTTSAGGLIPAYAWTHIAIVRSSSTVRGYVNGAQVLSQATTPNTTSARTLSICGATDDFFFEGYISNHRVVKGTAVYTSAFTPPTTPLTAISGTSLLTCQDPAFDDNSTNNFVLTQNGNPTVTGNSPFNTVGYWSNYFDGTGDYLTAPSNAAFAFGTGDYTVEAWVYPTSIRNGENLIYVTDVTQGMAFGYSQTTIYIGARATAYDLQASYTMPTNQWVHVAATRQSGTARIFVNGTQVGTGTITRSCPQGPGAVGDYPGVNEGVMGYLSNVRVIKGTALYTSNFTAPTAPLTAVSGTSLLTCQNGSFIDNSTNNFTITVNGNTSIQSFDPFYTATIASNGGSMYFDGSGDYLDIPSNPLFSQNSAFTVEMWVYPTVSSTDDYLYSQAASNFFQIATNPSGFVVIDKSAVGVQVTSSAALAVGAWTHIAMVSNGTTISLYVNGVSQGSASVGTTVSSATSVRIGAYQASGSLAFTGYISNLRVNKSAVYTANFTPPTAPVAPTAATTLLLNGMNAGIYDATTINDMETVGNAQVSTVQSKFGGSSVYFDGSGDWLQVNNNGSLYAFGTGNFTWEFWYYPLSFTNTAILLDFRTSGSEANGVLFTRPSTGSVWFNAAANTRITGTINLSLNTWAHIALTRSGGNTRLFINGVQSGSTYSDTNNYTGSPVRPLVGGDGFGGDASISANGYIDDLRVTKGVARYTANFTPPTQAFPTY